MHQCRLYLIGLLSITLVACLKMPPKANTETLAGLKALGASQVVKSGHRRRVNNVRTMAIQELAMTMGAQAGLAYRAKDMNVVLTQHERELEQSFNFQALLLEHNVLPPILGRGDNTLKQEDPLSLRVADRVYKIEQQAQFVTAPPNWRDYLWMDFEEPEKPHAAILPRTVAEQRIWEEYVEKGWNNGVKQADSILTDNIARMVHDFKGMLIYRKLLAQGMVSAPFVAKTDLGVTGDDQTLNIHDQVLRITALPTMQTDPTRWQAAVTAKQSVIAMGGAVDSAGGAQTTPGKDEMKPIIIKQDRKF